MNVKNILKSLLCTVFVGLIWGAVCSFMPIQPTIKSLIAFLGGMILGGVTMYICSSKWDLF